MQHIFTGTTAPASAPPGVGHHYVDTVAKKAYISVGTATTADWLEMNTGGGGGTFQKQQITLTGTDITNQYITLSALAVAGSLVVFQSRVMFAENVDYSVSNVGGVTRITFIPGGPIATGGAEAWAAGEVITAQFAV